MYRRSKFLEVLIAIREEMAREADFDVDLFAEMVRTGHKREGSRRHALKDPDTGPPRPRRKPVPQGKK